MAKASGYTPMMKHYLEVKERNKDAIIFYRLGDFYEMFFEDAKTASNELDLVLTGRNAGVPTATSSACRISRSNITFPA